MQTFLERLSSYNLFNYLFPGALFGVVLEVATGLQFPELNVVALLFLYYFVGLVISRVGSLILEPILKRIGFITFASYPDFLAAASKDPKIEVLSEVNNTYRTLAALFLGLALLIVGQLLFSGAAHDLPAQVWKVLGAIGLLAIFLWSYRKQTSYVTQRVSAILHEHS